VPRLHFAAFYDNNSGDSPRGWRVSPVLATPARRVVHHNA